MITGMLYAAAVLGGIGILTGLFLGIANEKFNAETDQRQAMVREALPGINCGRCGFAGCDALAQAIAEGNAGVGACPVGGKKAAEKIAGIKGVQVEIQKK